MKYGTLRGKPPDRRKATVMLKGRPGTGKTLISSIMTRGLACGIINSKCKTFPMNECVGAEAIIWEESSVDFQDANYWKQVLQGEGYIIDQKNKKGAYQKKWVPVVATTNERAWPANVYNVDAIALRDRCWMVELDNKWWSCKNYKLQHIDWDKVAAYIDGFCNCGNNISSSGSSH